jgi:hypothetical protein
MACVGWDVRLLEEGEALAAGLGDDSYDQVAAAIDKLEHDSPTLGRPLVDRIEGSRRTGSAGTTRASRKPIGGTTRG